MDEAMRGSGSNALANTFGFAQAIRQDFLGRGSNCFLTAWLTHKCRLK